MYCCCCAAGAAAAWATGAGGAWNRAMAILRAKSANTMLTLMPSLALASQKHGTSKSRANSRPSIGVTLRKQQNGSRQSLKWRWRRVVVEAGELDICRLICLGRRGNSSCSSVCSIPAVKHVDITLVCTQADSDTRFAVCHHVVEPNRTRILVRLLARHVIHHEDGLTAAAVTDISVWDTYGRAMQHERQKAADLMQRLTSAPE